MDFTNIIPAMVTRHTLLRLAVRRGQKYPKTPPWRDDIRLPITNERIAYIEIPISEIDLDLLKDGAKLTRLTARELWDRGEYALGTNTPRSWTWRDELQAVISDGIMKMREDVYAYAETHVRQARNRKGEDDGNTAPA